MILSNEEVCDDGSDLPTLPEHKYFVVLEGNDMINQSTHIIKAWYDYDANKNEQNITANNIV